jgi:Type IV secretion-system coupling protein DNA-binding domain
VWDVLHNEYLGVMLNAPERKFDIAACIRDRKTVLVNTRMVDLKNAHQTLGRFIITLTADAIRSRSERHPVYFVIDEFQEFADVEKTPEMLRLIREYGGGAVLAHQNMYCTEFDDAIRSAISTNTSIKYASSSRGMDIGYMARDMQCDGDFLSRQCVKSADTARFACFFTGLQHPFIKEFPFGEIAGWPRISDADYENFRSRNRASLYSQPKMYGAPEIEALREVTRPPKSPPETPRTETPAPRSAQIETRTTPPRPPEAPTMPPRSAATKGDPAEPSDSW